MRWVLGERLGHLRHERDLSARAIAVPCGEQGRASHPATGQPTRRRRATSIPPLLPLGAISCQDADSSFVTCCGAAEPGTLGKEG